MITQKRLKEVIRYNPETGVFRNISVTRGPSKKGKVYGVGINHKRIMIGVDYRRYLAHRLAWLYVYGYFPEHGIDHIDRNPSNNSISNLRDVTQTCNMRNIGNQKNNKSGIKGICFDKHRGKWKVYIKIKYKQVVLGRFDEFDEAVCHRLAAEQAEDWDGCDSSSPAYKAVENLRAGKKAWE